MNHCELYLPSVFIMLAKIIELDERGFIISKYQTMSMNIDKKDLYKIFIVEDDNWYGEILQYHLSLNPDYEVTLFQTGKECLSKMHLGPDLITLDFSLPDLTGDKLFKKIREINPQVPVIMISSQEDISVAVNLLKMGVSDYLIKDEATKDLLWNSVIRIRETQSLKKEVENLREELGQKYSFDKSIDYDFSIVPYYRVYFGKKKVLGTGLASL